MQSKTDSLFVATDRNGHRNPTKSHPRSQSSLRFQPARFLLRSPITMFDPSHCPPIPSKPMAMLHWLPEIFSRMPFAFSYSSLQDTNHFDQECDRWTAEPGLFTWIRDVMKEICLQFPVLTKNAMICTKCFIPPITEDFDFPSANILFNGVHLECSSYRFDLYGPPILLLANVTVREVLMFEVETKMPSPQETASFLCKSWLPSLSNLHKVLLLHHFLLRQTNYSPRTLHLTHHLTNGRSHRILYQGHEQENNTFVEEMEQISKGVLISEMEKRVGSTPLQGSSTVTEHFRDNTTRIVHTEWKLIKN